jgi:hypothetical protein
VWTLKHRQKPKADVLAEVRIGQVTAAATTTTTIIIIIIIIIIITKINWFR